MRDFPRIRGFSEDVYIYIYIYVYILYIIYIYIYQIINNCDAITKTLVKHLPEDREKNMKLSVVN